MSHSILRVHLRALFPELQELPDSETSGADLEAILASWQAPQQGDGVIVVSGGDRLSYIPSDGMAAATGTLSPRTFSRSDTLFAEDHRSLKLSNADEASQHFQLDPSLRLQDYDNAYSSRYSFETADSTGPGAQPARKRRRPVSDNQQKIQARPFLDQIGETRTNPDAKGLLDLPAKLRNHIYELVFTTEPPTKPKTDLHEALAPVNKELLFTCHQIYNEAVHFYRSAYKSYWLETRFVLDHQTKSLTPGEIALISRLPYDDVQHVCHLEILASDSESFVLVDACGIWKKTTTDNDTGAVTGEDWIVPCDNYWEVEAKIWDNEESAWEQCSQRDFPRLPVSDQVRFLWEVYGS